MMTVAAALLTVPPLTLSCATYVPATSILNVGWTLAGLVSAAVLPAGRVISDHAYVSASPSTSLDAEASRVIVWLMVPVWLGPAFATCGEFLVESVTVLGALLAAPAQDRAFAGRSTSYKLRPHV